MRRTNNLKKGSWTSEEDEKLISYINKYGIWNWSHMPKFAGLSRSGKSCRLRWVNYLKPNLKRGEFSKEEEETIIRFHSLLGNRWSAIASKLPGRTDNDVKNHWYVHLKKRVSDDRQKQQLVCQSTVEPNDFSNSPPGFGDIQEPADAANYDHMNDGFSLEHEISSSSSTTTTASKDGHGLEFGDDCYNNICTSPGTFDDLQFFWDQLCPFENLDGFFGHQVVQGSNDDLISSYTIYNINAAELRSIGCHISRLCRF